MRLTICLTAALVAACSQQAEAPPADNATVETNATAPAATPAAFQINETSWEFTREGKATTESIDANGNYVAWSGAEHIDHGTVVMKNDKACFTSAMDQEGEVCWTTQPQGLEIGQSMETTSDKGEKLTVKRIAFMAVPDAVKP